MAADSPTHQDGQEDPPVPPPVPAAVDPHDSQERLRRVSEGRAEVYDAQASAAESLREYLHRTEAERRRLDAARADLERASFPLALDLTRLVSEGATADDLLQHILEHLVLLFESSKSSILVPDEAGTHLRVATWRSLGEPVREDFMLPLGEGVAGHSFVTGEVVVVENTAECDIFVPCDEVDVEPAYLVCIPLKADDQVLGVMSFERPLGMPAPLAKIEQVVSYASHCAVQLRNILVYQNLLTQITELSVLCEISRELSSSLEHEQLLQKIVDSATQLLHCGICSLMLFEDDKQTLRIRHAVGLPQEVVERAVVRPGEGVSGWVAETGQPLLIEDITKDERFQRRDERGDQARKYSTRSLLSVPLLIGTEVVGVLNVNNKANNAVFTTHDRDNLTMLASQAAVSIENARLYETLQRLAVTDPLTKLFRRNYFEEQMTGELRRCQRYDRPLSVLMLDIDHFKQVNDTYGHQAGDAVLRDLAGLLRRYGRKDDVIARYGGEEFVVYLVETDYDGALLAGERIRSAAAAHPFQIGLAEPLKLTVSVGCAAFPRDADTVEGLVRCADLALYRAKRGGRNRVVGYEPGMDMSDGGEAAGDSRD